MCERVEPCGASLARHQIDSNEIVARRFCGVLWPQFEAVLSPAGSSSSEKEGDGEDGGGEEEDEDADGDAQDVCQQLLLQVFSCRKLTLQCKARNICFTFGVF